MEQLHKGTFFGNTGRAITLNGLTLTETDYVHSHVDWHYHELPYFTYLLQGQLLEVNQRQSYQCVAGDLLFHNWHDAHYNRKPGGLARGFHVEIDGKWLQQFDISLDQCSGSFQLSDPELMIRMARLYRASFYDQADLPLALETALIGLLEGMSEVEASGCKQKPAWVGKVKALIHDQYASALSLQMIAREGGVHPVHMCRDFSRYFHCTPSAYIRKVRIERSLPLLHDQSLRLSDIAYDCGFADQSHFIRAFRAQMGCSPGQYRRVCKG